MTFALTVTHRPKNLFLDLPPLPVADPAIPFKVKPLHLLRDLSKTPPEKLFHVSCTGERGDSSDPSSSGRAPRLPGMGFLPRRRKARGCRVWTSRLGTSGVRFEHAVNRETELHRSGGELLQVVIGFGFGFGVWLGLGLDLGWRL